MHEPGNSSSAGYLPGGGGRALQVLNDLHIQFPGNKLFPHEIARLLACIWASESHLQDIHPFVTVL
jgi:hypothetical protein